MMYDSLIVGAGPAGLSAAIYLARFNRQVLVIDRGEGRTATYELNENYLGFPEGIHARQLIELGKRQAERFGVQFISDSIQTAKKTSQGFELKGAAQSYHAKTVILATGVTDLYPNLENYQDFLGKTLFWCITCDGYKTRDKKLTLIGDSDEAACTALQFKNYTPDIVLVTNYPENESQLSNKWHQRLLEANISIVEDSLSKLHGHGGMVEAIETQNGTFIETDIIFNLQGAVPNNSLATELGAQVNAEGYIETDDEQRTTVPFVYAAGDVTRRFSHQIITAAHEGSMAAQAANYDLYAPEQRME